MKRFPRQTKLGAGNDAICESRLIADGMLEALGDDMAGTDVHLADKLRRIGKYLHALIEKTEESK